MNKKEAILNAAIQLFAERGFSATPTSAVAKMAGVAEGLIFHHFKNKESILVHILIDMMDTYLEGIKGAVGKADTGLGAIESAIRFHFRFSEERSEEFLILIRDFQFDLISTGSPARKMVENRITQVLNLLKKCIVRGQKDGSIRKLPAKRTSFILQGMLNGVSRLILMAPGIPPMPDFPSDVVTFCRRSLGKMS